MKPLSFLFYTASRLLLVGSVLCVIGSSPTYAQNPSSGKPAGKGNPLAALQTDNKQPITVEADKLDVLDKENQAIFSGKVIAAQGDTVLKSELLTVYYEPAAGTDPSTPASASANVGIPSVSGATQGASGRKIKKLEAKGNVVVLSKDQTATGDVGVYDAKTETVVLTGKVTLTQGPNVITGNKLFIDVPSGRSRIETSAGGRVRGLFVPGSEAAGNKP
jgi:lipopolysaccharide export system protein LptA